MPLGVSPDREHPMKVAAILFLPLALLATKPAPRPPRRAVSFVSAPMYAGPSIDEQIDARDQAQAEADRLAVVAAEIAAAEADAARIELERVAALRALQRPVAPLTVGSHSDAWWQAIAICESGGVSGWRTGYFGIMDGSAAGDMPYSAQLARAREIWSWAGDGAWGCSPVAYRAVPSG